MNNYRIMILDDEEENIELLQTHLTLAGYTNIEAFTDTNQAIERFTNEKFHVVLLDLDMPNREGTEVLKEMKQYDSLSQIIIMTEYCKINTTLACLELGANDYLIKPIKSSDYVLEVVEYSLKKLERWKNAIKESLIT